MVRSYPSGGPQAVFAALAKLPAQKRLCFEYRFQHKDGSYRWLRADVALVKNEAGTSREIVGCWIDITSRKEAEETQAQMAAIVESSEDAIISRTLDDTIISWNPASERLLGYSAREMVGRSFKLLVPRDRMAELRHIQRQILQGGLIEQVETLRRAKGGRSIEVFSTNSPIKNRDGKVIGISAILRDITFQKWADAGMRSSAQALATFFTEAPIGLLWVAPDGLIVRVNRAQAAMLGRRTGELFGRQLIEFCADPPEVTDMLKRLAQNQSLHDHRLRLRGQDGSLLHALVDANALWEKGKLIHSCWFVRDVTQRVALQKEILAVGEQVQSRIGQDLHDDLCQQLTGIEFLARSLERRLAGSSPAEASRAAEVTQLTRQAITHARELAHGMTPLDLESDGLGGALRNLAARVKKIFNIDCRFRDDLQERVEDPLTRIYVYRVAQEAITNAIKHGKAGRIEVRAAMQQNHLVLRVQNNGLNFPRKSRGRGMGLRMMEYRAGTLGGSLALRQRRQGGTDLVCTIPQFPLKTEGERKR